MKKEMKMLSSYQKMTFACALGAVMLASAGLTAADEKSDEKAPAPAARKVATPAVVVDKVGTLTHTEPKQYVGAIQAIEEVTIPARVSGRIEEILFEQGSMVKKGDLLFVLEDTTYEADVLSAKAVLAQTEAEYKYAQSEYARKSELYAKNAVSKTEFENTSRLIAFTKAKMDEAQAAVMRAENQLSYTRIYAPLSGRIGAINYTVGNYVTPSTPNPLTDIVQVDPVYVAFSVSERDFLNSFVNRDGGAKPLVTMLLANGKQYLEQPKVDFIDNRVDAETGTITIWVTCPNSSNELIPGGYVKVLLADEFKEPLPAVNVTALLTDRESNYVYVVGEDNVARRRNIKVGGVVDNMQLVLEGVKPGETIVTDGLHKVIPNAEVIPEQAQKLEGVR